MEIRSTDPDLKEIIDAYGITGPSVLVFRKGNLAADYRGSFGSEDIAEYIAEDVKVCVIGFKFSI